MKFSTQAPQVEQRHREDDELLARPTAARTSSTRVYRLVLMAMVTAAGASQGCQGHHVSPAPSAPTASLVTSVTTPVKKKVPKTSTENATNTTIAAVHDEPTAHKCGEGQWQPFDNPSEAFRKIVNSEVTVLGVGELHAVRGMSAEDTTLHRFRTSMLPELAGRKGALVLETWAPSGACGGTEKRAVHQIKKQISSHQSKQAPSELVSLLRDAKADGLIPYVLHPTCEDYRAMRDEKGRLAPVGLLETVGRMLGRQTLIALNHLQQPREGTHTPLVVVYGGAIHNDAHPLERRAAYSFGRRMRERLGDKYGEVDIIVPELADRMTDMLAEEPWQACFSEASEAKATVLVTNGPRSWTIILRRRTSKTVSSATSHETKPKAPAQAPTTITKAAEPNAP